MIMLCDVMWQYWYDMIYSYISKRTKLNSPWEAALCPCHSQCSYPHTPASWSLYIKAPPSVIINTAGIQSQGQGCGFTGLFGNSSNKFVFSYLRLICHKSCFDNFSQQMFKESKHKVWYSSNQSETLQVVEVGVGLVLVLWLTWSYWPNPQNCTQRKLKFNFFIWWSENTSFPSFYYFVVRKRAKLVQCGLKLNCSWQFIWVWLSPEFRPPNNSAHIIFMNQFYDYWHDPYAAESIITWM